MMNRDSETTLKESDTQNIFGLSEQEKSSIEADIMANKPIGDTPAYRKFLRAIFPDREPTFPYLADYDDALTIVSQLSMLCSRPVRLSKEVEAHQSLKDYNHLTGCRGESTSRVEVAGDCGFAWLFGGARSEFAPFAWRAPRDLTCYDMRNRRYCHSVIPVFG